MTMHRVDVSPRFDVPANGRPHPTPTITRASAADAAVCEWAAELDLGPVGSTSADSTTSLASTGFVDFDAMETVRISSVAASR
jgi:hypothetical protein